MPLGSLAGVLCAGNISHDILVRPVNEFNWGTSTWVEEFVEDMGGNGSNTAYALGMLGVPVRLLGKVGPDDRGEGLMAKLRGVGADVSFVGRSPQPTTTTICVINSKGDRLFLQRVGASGEAFSEVTDFSKAVTTGFSHYHQANLYSLPSLRLNSAAQMRAAKQAGLTTSLDTGWATDGRWMEILAPALPFTDLMFVNEDESRMLTGHTEPDAVARVLRENGATNIVMKLGARGCAVFTEGESFRVPGFEVTAVDTTGAGDCFAAGLFAGLYRGMSLREAASVANAVGAMSVTVTGANRGVRPWPDTQSWLKNRAGK